MEVDDRPYLKRCLELIEQKQKWGPSIEWTNNHFTKLHDEIHSSTNLLISVSTLRRLFSRIKESNEYYNPQLDTKDALAQFIGFENWAMFKESKQVELDSSSSITTDLNPEDVKGKTIKVIVWGLLITVSLAIIFQFISRAKQEVIGEYNVSLKESKGESPFTVILNYDVSLSEVDSLFFNFGDGTPWVLIDKEKKVLTHTYGNTGVYSIKFRSKSKVYKYLPILIQSKGWEYRLRFPEKLTYFSKCDSSFFADSILKLPVYIAENDANSKDDLKEYFLEYRFVKSLIEDPSDFSVEAVFKNSKDVGGISCYNTVFSFMMENGQFKTTFIDKGCSRWADVQAMDTVLDGRYVDLTSLSKDVSEWKKVKFKVENKIYSVYDGKTKVIELPFKREPKKLLGFYINFRGSGVLQSLRLFDSSGDLVYDSNFASFQ